MERERIGQGYEHTVYRAKHNPEWVLKKPRIHQYFSSNALQIRQEIQEKQELLAESTIKIPETRIFSLQKGYVIAQKFIDEDNSVEVEEHLQEQNIPHVMHRYHNNPQNFISNSGAVYWVDPTKGFVTRLLERYHIMSEDTYRKTKDRVRNFFKK